MKKLTIPITGMDCASCAMNIERRLKKLKGIENANVNYATNKATVEYDETKVGPGNFKETIEGLGYGADIDGEENARKGKGRMRLHVIGMDSMHCAMNVEKALKRTPGVSKVGLNFSLEKADIEYDEATTDFSKVRKAIIDAGYDAELMDLGQGIDKEKLARENEIKNLKDRVIYSILLTIPVLLLSLPEMLKGMIALEYPLFFIKNMAALQFLLSTPVLYLNREFFTRGFRGLINRMPGMDSLVALAVGTAYVYSVLVGFGFISGSVYYETAALLLTFIVIGKYLEAVAKGKTSEAIKRLIGLQPKTALVVRDGKEVEIAIKDVAVGDIIVVKPGGKVPVDGVVTEGSSSVDESMITGESIAVHKTKGDIVIGATINKIGSFRFKATKIGSDTMLAQIIKLVEDAQGSKAPIQDLSDMVAGYFVQGVIAARSPRFRILVFHRRADIPIRDDHPRLDPDNRMPLRHGARHSDCCDDRDRQRRRERGPYQGCGKPGDAAQGDDHRLRQDGDHNSGRGGGHGHDRLWHERVRASENRGFGRKRLRAPFGRSHSGQSQGEEAQDQQGEVVQRDSRPWHQRDDR